MQKLTVKYADERIDVMIIPETMSVSTIMNQISENCINHNNNPPEFFFDDWEGYEH